MALCKCGNIKSKLAKQCQKCYLTNNNPFNNKLIRDQITKKQQGHNHPWYIDGRSKEKYYCITCNKEISNHSGNKRFNKHRCKSCAKKGKYSPFYVNGNSDYKYPTKFSYALKVVIRKKYSYKCAICGQVAKDVHHIDYNKQNCEEENLIVLCKKHHNKTNFNRDYWYAYFLYIKELEDVK